MASDGRWYGSDRAAMAGWGATSGEAKSRGNFLMVEATARFSSDPVFGSEPVGFPPRSVRWEMTSAFGRGDFKEVVPDDDFAAVDLADRLEGGLLVDLAGGDVGEHEPVGAGLLGHCGYFR